MHHLAYICEDAGIPLDGSKGSSIHARSMVRALAEVGARISLVAPRIGSHASLDHPGIQKLHLQQNQLAQNLPLHEKQLGWQAIGSILDFIHESNPLDAVYERLSLWSAGAAQWCRRRGVPHMVEVNAPLVAEAAAHRDLSDVESALAIEREVLLSATHLIAVSPWLCDWLRAQGCDPGRIRLLPNAVSEEWLIPAARLPFADAPARIELGFVGSLRPWHDVQTLLEAMVLLRGTPFHLTIVGDGPMRRTLEDWVQGQGLESSVAFKGSIAHESMPELLDQLDLCLAPYSDNDGFYFCPIKLFEYGARARPVVASDLPELRRLFPAEVLFTHTPGDPRNLAALLLELAAMPSHVIATGERLKEFTIPHTWEANARKVLRWALERPIRRDSVGVIG